MVEIKEVVEVKDNEDVMRLWNEYKRGEITHTQLQYCLKELFKNYTANPSAKSREIEKEFDEKMSKLDVKYGAKEWQARYEA